MDLKLVTKKDVPLLARTEVQYDLTYTGTTPSRVDIKKEVCTHQQWNSEQVVVKHIEPVFGFGKAKVTVFCYQTAKDLAQIEEPYALRRQQKDKQEQKAEKKPQEKSEEKKKK
ncbi:hypothetical protein HYW21_06950 [Candidatus Woesearchaeota archaeon]|nr:hypothetical protein [Candidatus Woesearchaeota archaeon]